MCPACNGQGIPETVVGDADVSRKFREASACHVQARIAKAEARQEKERLAAEQRLSFKQKEKRKRELGQAKGGKGNYVEEEKRIARQFGVYSGFD